MGKIKEIPEQTLKEGMARSYKSDEKDVVVIACGSMKESLVKVEIMHAEVVFCMKDEIGKFSPDFYHVPLIEQFNLLKMQFRQSTNSSL